MTHDEQIAKVKEKFGDTVCTEKDRVGCPILWVKPDQSTALLKFLKETDGLEYCFLSDLTAYDDMGTDDEEKGRFVVVYNLLSLQYKIRLRVKVRAAEGATVPTAVNLWDAANWAEREVYDMFGIKFEGHPDMRRILMDVRWDGYPLRKDYPLRRYQLFNDPEPIPYNLLKE